MNFKAVIFQKIAELAVVAQQRNVEMHRSFL